MAFRSLHAHDKPCGAGCSTPTRGLVASGIEPREQRRADAAQIGPGRDRDELLPANSFATSLDATFVVAGARSSEARLDEIVRRDLQEAQTQHTLAADENARDRRTQIVVEQAVRHEAKMLEGS